MSCCDICDELAWTRQALTLLLQKAGLQVPGGGSPPVGFQVDAVHFGSTSDSITGNQSIPDGPEGSIVYWIKGEVGNVLSVAETSGQYFLSFCNSATGPSLQCYPSVGAEFLETSSDQGIPDLVWACIMQSWKTDLSTGNKLVTTYIGDTSTLDTVSDDGSFSTFYGDNPWTVGSNLSDSDLAELWFDDAYIDFSVEANRRLFYSASGKPVDLGTDGSTPTGSAPRIYLSVRPGDSAADFCTNRGTGGNFTENGTLSIASTSPSD